VTDLAQSIAELTEPTTHELQRAPANDTVRAELERAERKALRERIEQFRDREMHTAIDALLRRHGAELAGRAPTTAAVPSLLDQLAEAVQGSGGSNGASGAGAYRSAIGLAAAGLLVGIRQYIGCHTPDLAEGLRAWAALIQKDPALWDLAEQERIAEGWLVQAKAIVEPPRWSEIPAACPLCGSRYVTVWEDGERVRRAALRINLTHEYAECGHPDCAQGHWDRDRLRDLAALL
jgi:hypothetical protein